MTNKPQGEPKASDQESRFDIYRGADARDIGEILTFKDMTPIMVDGLTRFGRNKEHGAEVKLVYARPGFSLSHVWFKSDYPLPLHSHGSDCLYHIIAGSIRIGDQILGRGDGFFVGSDVPYTYTTGPEGVEVLEFRNTAEQDIRYQSKTKNAWDKMVSKIEQQQEEWADEVRPSQLGREGANATIEL